MGDVIQQDLRLRHLSAAHRLAGQQAAGGGDDLKAIPFQGGDVVLGDGVFQHGRVHGRGDQLLALGRQDHGGQHVVRDAVGELGDDVRRGRGDENEVRCLRQGDVGDIVLEIPGEGIHHAPVVGQGLKGQGGDELGGVLGHDDVDLRPGLPQGAGHVGNFIGGNAPGDAQQHALSFQVFHFCSSCIRSPYPNFCCGKGVPHSMSFSRPCFS